MLGKMWKKILLLVLIIACLFNIIHKIIDRNTLKQELQSTLDYKLNEMKEEIQTKTNNKSDKDTKNNKDNNTDKEKKDNKDNN